MRCIDRVCILALLTALLAGCVTSAPSTTPAARPAAAKAKPAPAEPPVSVESRQAYEQALTALNAGRYPEAERLLLALVQREPKLAGPRANLGILYARTNRSALAVDALQQAIRLNSERASYHNELGLVFRRDGKFDDARRCYDDALGADPNYANAHLNLGILYDLYLQEPAKAMQHYQRYRELVPAEAATVTKWIADLQQRGRTVEQNKGGKSG